jgi:hypothetical protein
MYCVFHEESQSNMALGYIEGGNLEGRRQGPVEHMVQLRDRIEPDRGIRVQDRAACRFLPRCCHAAAAQLLHGAMLRVTRACPSGAANGSILDPFDRSRP